MTDARELIVSDHNMFVPANAEKAVILLHGFGANGDDMAGLIPDLQKYLPNTAFYCPSAPYQASEDTGSDFDFPADALMWFPVSDELKVMASGRIEEFESFYIKLKKKAAPAALLVNNFADKVKDWLHLQDKDLAFAGFSQGGELAVAAAFTRKEQIAAAVGFSATGAGFDLQNIRSRPPLLMIHGDEDRIIPYSVHKMVVDLLKADGVKMQQFIMKGYGHTINEEAIEKAGAFLKANLIR